MRALWTDHRNGDKIDVIATKDEDGDWLCSPIGSSNRYDTWTTYQSELNQGRVSLEET